MADAGTTEQVRRLLKAELANRGVAYPELARLITSLGVPMGADEVADRVERGEISGAFFTLCYEAIGAPVIPLDF